jgi:hypothetical protein
MKKTTQIRAAAVVLASVAAVQAAAAQTAMTQEQVERRHNVRVFGSVLVSAAQYGAELMGRRVQQIDPSVVLLSGTAPRAQGFVLDGHGVFFHVEIPKIDSVVAWALTNRGRDDAALNAIAGLKSFAQSIADPAQRQMMVTYVNNLERRFMPSGMQRLANGGAQPNAPAPNADAPAPAVRPRPMDNPDLEYEKMVTDQLVNAMLDYGHQLGLGADEWLTVAARGSQGTLIPEMVFDDTVTITLRIKGSDLAEFRAGKLSRDEARARVVVREF